MALEVISSDVSVKEFVYHDGTTNSLSIWGASYNLIGKQNSVGNAKYELVAENGHSFNLFIVTKKNKKSYIL